MHQLVPGKRAGPARLGPLARSCSGAREACGTVGQVALKICNAAFCYRDNILL